MGFSYTEQQQQVIDCRNSSLLVSAAAGSGKTAVLTERIVRMVSNPQEPVDIDRLLIVTFTNAAAAEMRERISLALGKRLEEEPDNAHLQRQMTLLHNAQITTIDSFCLFIIRNNFNDIGIDPGFRVADEGELKLLRGETIEELLEECFEEGEEAFFTCVESFNQNGDEKTLTEYILKLYDFSRSYPFPKKWLLMAKENYAPDKAEEAEQSEWLRFAVADMKKTVSGCVLQIEKALAICEEPDGPYMYAPLLEAEREMLSAYGDKNSFTEWEDAFAKITFGRLPSKKDESVSAEKREFVKEMRNEIKAVLEKIRKQYFFLPFEQALSDMQRGSDIIRTLTELTLRFGEKLQEKKREKNILDFGDMEHYALQILLEEAEDGSYVPTKAAKEYRKYFHEIMIDEYQDSNLVQEYLLQSISGEAEGRYNRFMVGDVKQSIYKFRLARPKIFMEKYERYGEAGPERKINLYQNFRSRKEVTDSVNHVFSRIMGKELGGIVYDEKAALYPGAVYPACETCESELLLLEEDTEKKLTKAEQEAGLIAGRIRRLMESQLITDKESGLLRPVRYGDIAILLRSSSGWDDAFQKVLQRNGIPAHVSASTGYFASEEIRTMLHFLRILDNPLQDIPMFGVMRSPIGGFTEKEMAQLRTACPDGKLYDALQSAESSKARQFLALLTKYRQKVAYVPVKQLLREVMAETGYMQYMTAFPGGERRRANLEMLLLKAVAFEKTGSRGLFSFIRYMEQLEKYDVDYGEAGVIDEHADVVRIMSIHKSKGLEFPVCIVAGLGKRFNIQDQTRSMLMDADYGIGCEYVDIDSRLRRTTLRRNVLARKQQLDNLGEELRILYVAMTRAKEKLIMTACLADPERKLTALGMWGEENLWRQKSGVSSFLTLSTAGSLLEFLLPVWECIRIVKSEELSAEEVKTAVKEQWNQIRLAEYEKETEQSELQKIFAERFAFRYPWENLAGLYTKTTVSELKMEKMTDVSEGAMPLFDTEVKEAYVPRFCREEEKQSGSMRGSAFHRVMELLDFSELSASLDLAEMTKSVNRWMQTYLQEGRLQQEQYACVRAEKISAFLLSETAKRMEAAAREGRLYKEQPFMLGLSAEKINTDFPADETVLIQGIIDVYWEEEDGLVVLDYKTDRVDSAEELISRYRTQLDYYGEALEQITGKKVKEKLIYSFRFDKILYCI